MRNYNLSKHRKRNVTVESVCLKHIKMSFRHFFFTKQLLSYKIGKLSILVTIVTHSQCEIKIFCTFMKKMQMRC